jgi:hypothetical protein
MLGVAEKQGPFVLPISASITDSGRTNQKTTPGTGTADLSRYYW